MPKFIAYATPSLGMVSIWWSRCVQSILHPNNTGKAIFYLRDNVGGEIAEVRNGIVSSVLEYDANVNPVSHIFWIDDDVLVFPGCLLELLHQDRDIASGVYFTKLPDNLSSPLIYSQQYGGTDRFIPNKVYAVWGHGMGLTLIRTEVYKRMRDELLTRQAPDGSKQKLVDKYGRPKWYHTTKLESEVVEDEQGVIHTGFTEDTYFLTNVAKLGYKPVIDTNKHAMGFHYDSVKDVGYPTEQWNQWLRGEPITWKTPDGEVRWE